MKVYLRQVRLNSSGYTNKGEYFGLGAPLYYYEKEDGSESDHIRARSRSEAEYKIRHILSNEDIQFFHKEK